MKLTGVLFRWKKALPRGHIWRGKYRLYKEVTKDHLRLLKRAYDLEEKNMFYLRHPYLTPEQSYGHMNALYGPAAFGENNRRERIRGKSEHTYLGDRFGFLKITDAWE